MFPLHTVFKDYSWDQHTFKQLMLHKKCLLFFSYSKGAREPVRFPSSMKYQTWLLTLNHLLRATNGRNKKPISYLLLKEGQIKKKLYINSLFWLSALVLHLDGRTRGRKVCRVPVGKKETVTRPVTLLFVSQERRSSEIVEWLSE